MILAAEGKNNSVQRQSFKVGLKCGIMLEGVELGTEARRGQGEGWHKNCGSLLSSSTGSTRCQDVRACCEPFLWILSFRG